MGNYIEVNDTLHITEEQGFPVDTFNLNSHSKKPVTLSDVEGKIFQFQSKPRARVFHLEPVRIFLVQNIDGKWLFWGHAQIQEQTIQKKLNSEGQWAGEWQTSGSYTISKIYSPDQQIITTQLESPAGRSYFEESE